MLKLPEELRAVIQQYILGSMSTTHTIHAAVGISNTLEELETIEEKEQPDGEGHDD